MLTIAMVVAAVYGVVQLAVLSSPARSVGIGMLLLAVGVGVYGAATLGVLLEIGYTRVMSAVSGDRLSEVVQVAGYTVDPFIEEVIKVLPLLAVGLHVRSRTQWGLTDYLVVGAAVGAGFGLLEAILRFSHRAGNAVDLDGGWLLPVSLASPYIPSFDVTLTSWLPAPVTVETLALLVEPGTYRHLVWSAVAGVGIGLLFRVRGPARVLGLVPLLLAGADHAAYNFDVNLLAESGFGEAISAPFIAAKPVLWLWPLLALAGAMAADLVVGKRALAGHPRLRLAGERDADPLNRIIALPRYAVLKMPWTVLLVIRFVRMRRAALYGTIRPDQAEPALDRVADVRRQLDASSTAAAWRGVGRVSLAGTERTGRWWRRYWPVVVWALLFVPPLVYFVIGSTPGMAGAQELLESSAGFALVAVLALVGVVWVGWCLVRAVLALPTAVRSPEGVVLAQVEMRIVLALGALVLGAFAIISWLGGTGAGDPLISNLHVLDALSDALLVLGVALLLGAFIFFPPAGVVAVAGGGAVIVPTITGGFVAMGTLGITGIMLSQAADAGGTSSSGSGGGAGSGKGVPPKPPRPKPQVRHWKLRRIVDQLWKGTGRSDRVGDGTTMDAVRNELLTGRPTQGKFHTIKAQVSLRALKRWIDVYGPQATRADRQWARQLRSELERLLEKG